MIIELADIKSHLRIEVPDDDALLTAKIATAEKYIEAIIGSTLAVAYPDGTPDPLKEAARMLVGLLYQNREMASGDALYQLPVGFNDLVRPYRTWVFG